MISVNQVATLPIGEILDLIDIKSAAGPPEPG